MVFYALGRYLKDLQYTQLLIWSSLMLLIVMWLFCPVIVNMYGNYVQNDGVYLLWYPFCLAGIVVMNNVIRLIPNGFFSYFKFENVGVNSITYYLAHFSIMVLVCKLCLHYKVCSEWELLFYVTLVSFILLPIIAYCLNTKKFRFIIGK